MILSKLENFSIVQLIFSKNLITYKLLLKLFALSENKGLNII